MNTCSQSMLEQVEAIARLAGAAILKIYEREFAVQEKADKSPLTEADSAANDIIVGELARLYPDIPILSEEAVSDFKASSPSRYWLVDPLDGTREFVQRNGEFTVNIALIENGRAILGAVYAPVLDRMYSAAAGIGAFKCDGTAARESIRVARHAQGQTWRVVGSRSHAGDSLGSFLAGLQPHQLISMGSSLKICLVAAGEADVYPRLGPTSLWDTAAAQCVVEQAGGAVIQLNGEALSYSHPQKTLNPFFIVHGESDMNWSSLAAQAA